MGPTQGGSRGSPGLDPDGITRLTPKNVIQTEDSFSITFGGDPVEIPEPLARLVRQFPQLAGEVPPVVLADLLGISINNAVRWAEPLPATGPATPRIAPEDLCLDA